MQRSANRVSRRPLIVRGVSWIGSIGIISSGIVGTPTQNFPEASDSANAQELPPPDAIALESDPAEVLFIDESGDFDAVPPETYAEPEPEAYLPEAPTAPSYVEPPTNFTYYQETPAAVSEYEAATPVYEEPAYEEPAYEEPAYEEPAYEEPAYEPPSYVEAPAAPTYVEEPESYTYIEEPQPYSPDTETAEAEINNNVYIDPTEYTLGATDTYEEPAEIVLSERSTGCESVVTSGGAIDGACGAVAPAAAPAAAETYSADSYTLASTPAQTAAVQAVQPDAPPAAPIYAPPQAGQVSVPPQPAPVYTPSQPQQVAYQPSTATADYAYAAAPVTDYAQGAQLPIPPDVQSVNVGPISVGSDGINVKAALPPVRNYYNRNLLSAALPGNGNTSFIFPLAIPAPITSMFGWRVHPIYGSSRFHSGTDFGAPMGTPVLAAYSGEVVSADFMGGYGLTVVLQHNQATQETLYAHLSQVFVEAGDRIEQGTVIGQVGSTGNSTGPHLHFEFRQLTADGWVTMDPGAQLEYALAKLVQSLQTAQSTPKPAANKS